jgi:hypothetical protein
MVKETHCRQSAPICPTRRSPRHARGDGGAGRSRCRPTVPTRRTGGGSTASRRRPTRPGGGRRGQRSEDERRAYDLTRLGRCDADQGEKDQPECAHRHATGAGDIGVNAREQERSGQQDNHPLTPSPRIHANRPPMTISSDRARGHQRDQDGGCEQTPPGRRRRRLGRPEPGERDVRQGVPAIGRARRTVYPPSLNKNQTHLQLPGLHSG